MLLFNSVMDKMLCHIFQISIAVLRKIGIVEHYLFGAYLLNLFGIKGRYHMWFIISIIFINLRRVGIYLPGFLIKVPNIYLPYNK